MVNIKRWLTHVFTPPWRWRMAFSTATLKAIEKAVTESEHLHRGELRFAIENTLAPGKVWRGMSAYQRAVEVFADLHVWDTEENSGVLIYLLLADREVHVIADRGINKYVAQSEWDAIAKVMQEAFGAGDFRKGALTGISAITRILSTYFPAPAIVGTPNELPDQPVILGR